MRCQQPTPPSPPSGPDTTSHNWSFQTFVLGEGNSSKLNDVAIINDTLAYAVGEIYLKDSLGNYDPNAYNLVKWDGEKWELMRVPSKGPLYPNNIISYPPLKAIWVVAENSILLAWGGGIIKYNGINFTDDFSMNSLLKGAINKIFATSPKDIYIVGNGGTIVHYANGAWTKIESGTTTTITDVWGTGDTVLATVTNEYETGDKLLLQISPSGNVQSLNWSPNSRLQTVWFESPDKIFIGGGEHIVGKPNAWQEITSIPAYYSERVRGNHSNDVFIVGAYGLCSHFNGSTWQSYPEVSLSGGTYLSVAMKDNVVIAVGFSGSQAIAIRGYRK